jgi:hypothetical protein
MRGIKMENVECSPAQLMFTLIANYDADDYKAHFCSKKCLFTYVDKKVFDRTDLPNIKDGQRNTECLTIGEIHKEQEML